jgi:hypothetical protein
MLITLGGCAAISTTVRQRQVESVAQMGVQVNGVPNLTVIVPSGSVKLHTGEAGRVAAVVTRHGYGPTGESAQAAHDNLDVAFSQQGIVVTLEARRLGSLQQGQSDEAELDVTVPAGSTLTVRVANGEAVVTPAGGDVAIEVLNGSVTLYADAGDSFGFVGHVANGTIQSAFPGVSSQAGQNIDVDGQIGDEPAYTISVTCANGIIALNRVP